MYYFFIFEGITSSLNPWVVDSVHDFWCPECSFDTKEEPNTYYNVIFKIK